MRLLLATAVQGLAVSGYDRAEGGFGRGMLPTRVSPVSGAHVESFQPRNGRAAGDGNAFSPSSQSCESSFLGTVLPPLLLSSASFYTPTQPSAKQQPGNKASSFVSLPCGFAWGSDKSLCLGWRSILFSKDGSFLVGIIRGIFYCILFSVTMAWLIK